MNSSYSGIEEALVRLNQDGTTEEGYAPGEFDIHDNGSLIINHVKLEHEHEFTAVLFRDSSGNYDDFIVRVITTGEEFKSHSFPQVHQYRSSISCIYDAEQPSYASKPRY